MELLSGVGLLLLLLRFLFLLPLLRPDRRPKGLFFVNPSVLVADEHVCVCYIIFMTLFWGGCGDYVLYI